MLGSYQWKGLHLVCVCVSISIPHNPILGYVVLPIYDILRNMTAHAGLSFYHIRRQVKYTKLLMKSLTRHYHIEELVHHWSRQWLVSCLRTRHETTLLLRDHRDKFKLNLHQNRLTFIQQDVDIPKCRIRNVGHFIHTPCSNTSTTPIFWNAIHCPNIIVQEKKMADGLITIWNPSYFPNIICICLLYQPLQWLHMSVMASKTFVQDNTQRKLSSRHITQ